MHDWETRMQLKHYLELGMTKAELSRRFGVSRRTRTGGDRSPVKMQPRWSVVSIRAPARGATIHGSRMVLVWNVSIRAPVRGATKWTLQGSDGTRVLRNMERKVLRNMLRN